MNDRAHAADLRRLNKARAQEWHRNAGQVQVKKNPSVHEEGACKKLAHVLPWNPPEPVRHSTSHSCLSHRAYPNGCSDRYWSCCKDAR